MSLPKILIEHCVFYSLENCKNIELMILKGHLALELLMSSIVPNKNQSFYRKVTFIQNINELEFIGKSLLELNDIRNKLAHEYLFDIEKSDMLKWSEKIINSLEYNKFAKHTKKIKIAHAFSALAVNIYEYSLIKGK
ncbi:hypothetical protein N5U19_10725 [Aliarcobacter butzleri]|uniref:hypothetical protein n=1 Tax=Aliarcobacter butzleri TaxID=28197 RepID=UPI0021B5643D|nr:hypothetical protein [Aliarcobacter butzleri]MCT7651351.1 hypothetical protein [Aliarcobacter butzleri]